jgi:XTP/dITP diphosphohydrolase
MTQDHDRPTIVLATRNRGKAAELARLLEPHGVEVTTLAEYPEIGDIPETGDTFAENARIKADVVASATGLVAVADDSGLEVDALDGAPGVRSARFAGENADDAANNEKLLDALEGVDDPDRTARFVCHLVARSPSGETVEARGEWEGRILREPAGENGFGYDPLFLVPDLNRTSAQLDPDEKNARSHRGKALGKLAESWPGFWKMLS